MHSAPVLSGGAGRTRTAIRTLLLGSSGRSMAQTHGDLLLLFTPHSLSAVRGSSSAEAEPHQHNLLHQQSSTTTPHHQPLRVPNVR